VRSLSAALLVVLCAEAAAQQRGGVIARGGTAGGFQGGVTPHAMTPFATPYISSDLTFAQRLGATVSGSWNGLPAFWPPAMGQGVFRGWNGTPPFGAPGLSPAFCPRWNTPPAFAPGDSPVTYPVFAGPSAPGYYPQPAPNVTVVLPPQYGTEPAPPVMINEPSSGAGREFAPQGQDSASVERSGISVYQAPVREPVSEGEHPQLIVLKNGWVYTVTSYRVKGKAFNFVTTRGDHMQVPLSLLDRVYPRTNERSRSTDPNQPTAP
jgi:hypothetical protein